MSLGVMVLCLNTLLAYSTFRACIPYSRTPSAIFSYHEMLPVVDVLRGCIISRRVFRGCSCVGGPCTISSVLRSRLTLAISNSN